MSRLYDAVELSVINDSMLLEAIEDGGPKGMLKKLKDDEEVDYSEITSLMLEFKNILKIDNLEYFRSLTVLQLDNNVIEKITGLESLVNLTKLDLSFNNIETIEGLETLTQLEILNLFSNRISQICNMDNLTKLTILSMGDNLVEDINQLLYLRRHSDLKTLILSNNPISSKPEYKLAVAAILPNLRYLDYRIVRDQYRIEGREKYSILVDETEANEQLQQQQLEVDKQQEEQNRINKEAYIDTIIDGKLVKEMFAEDVEGQIFKSISFLEEIYSNFETNTNDVVEEICQHSLLERTNRLNEVTIFRKCLEEITEKTRNEGIELIKTFEVSKMQIISTFDENMNTVERNSLLEKYLNFVDEFQDQLFFIEVRLTEQIEDVTREFEQTLQENINNYFEKLRGLLGQLREIQGTYNENVIETGLVVLEKYLKNELSEEVSESIKTIFVDKDTMTGSAMASHDLHILKIDIFEDYIIKKTNMWFEDISKNLNNEEIERNRERIKEIYNYMDYCREEFEDLIELQG